MVFVALALFTFGCEDNVDPMDDDDAVADDDDAADSYEGDEPGECSDGADNDQDGLFDCDDEGCAGSPDCAGDDDDDDDDSSDDDTGDDDTGDDDTGDDETGDDDTGDDDTGDDDTGDDDTGDDDTGDDDTGDDDTGDDDTAPVDADGDGWDESVDCDDNDAALNLDDADGDGFSTCDGDCNDGNGAVNPLATDVVGDGTDQNCDGMDGTDADGDGHAADWSGGDDCDDTDAAIYPGAPEACDGIDSECDGDVTDEADDDGDGYRLCDGDCDDNDAIAYPGATELCDGIDGDCDGDISTELDDDGDGYRLCDGDCDDTNPNTNPGASEICDGEDNNCNGGTGANEFDTDGDGMMPCDGDCDDADPDTYAGAVELCDGYDQNCDGYVGDEDDADGDGYRLCDNDCDDADFDINPGAAEDCTDGIDNDCDGAIDGGQAGDSFLQSGNYTSDILFVVDNSCSMYEEQANLGTYFQNMYDVLTTEGIDFRIAVATTDTGDFQEDGNGVYVIDPSTPDPVLTFQTICDVGTTGSGTEQGLRFGLEALQLAEAGTAPNTGFWREDAGLRVIFVSDEQDQSPAGWLALTQDYELLKTNPEHVILNAITGTDGVSAIACTGAGGSAGAGYGYVDAVNYTGGILSSICDFDWTVIMEDLGYVSEHLADTFELSQVPDPAYIQVFVNGVEVFSGWTYDANINAVVFDPADVPADGDTVDIDYCL